MITLPFLSIFYIRFLLFSKFIRRSGNENFRVAVDFSGEKTKHKDRYIDEIKHFKHLVILNSNFYFIQNVIFTINFKYIRKVLKYMTKNHQHQILY